MFSLSNAQVDILGTSMLFARLGHYYPNSDFLFNAFRYRLHFWAHIGAE